MTSLIWGILKNNKNKKKENKTKRNTKLTETERIGGCQRLGAGSRQKGDEDQKLQASSYKYINHAEVM